MFGFYADCGYCSNYSGLKKLSDITFLDTHRLISFLEINFDTMERVEFGLNQTNEAAAYLEKILGDQYYAIYGIPLIDQYSSLTPEGINNIKQIVPSSVLSFPNTIEYITSNLNQLVDRVVCYIPTLSIVVGKSGSFCRYWRVSPDGSLRSFPTNGGYTFPLLQGIDSSYVFRDPQRQTATIRVLCMINGAKADGLWNAVDNVRELTISYYRSNTSNVIYFELSNPWGAGGNNDPFPLVFPKTIEPDYNINYPENPYKPGGPSGPTDPDLPPGTFDDESDPIPDSPLPTLSAANTGFTRIYNPTLSQVQALARYLWTDPDVLQTIWNHIKQIFEDPMQAIIGFNLVPVPVPNGGTQNFALMYIDTGVSMTVAANQFVDLDCGTVELKRYYGSALDQSPYTKVSCFLPYIGTVNLNTDEVMGTTLQVKYRVDIVSGSCVAKIFVDGNCLYQYSGHCAITIPISSADFSSYVSAAISVGKLAAAAITAGAGAAMSAGVAEASQRTNQVVTTTQVTNTARNPSTGRQITTGTTTTVQTRESPTNQSSTQASFSGLSPQNVANTVGAIMSSKPHIEHSGSFSGNSGYLGVRRPFLIIERPNMCMPANYQALNGFPAMITMELGTCEGFTRVQQVQLTGLHATNPEQAEILELLKSGVIL